MRHSVVFRLKWYDNDSASGWCQAWFSSEGKAKTRLAEIAKDEPMNFDGGSIEAIALSLTREGFIAFLNQHASVG